MKLLEVLRTQDKAFRRSLAFFFVAYAFVQLNYPLIRSSNTTFFIGAFGAKSTPAAIIVSVIVLSIAIFISNWFQRRFRVQTIFLGVSIFSVMVFLITTFGILDGIKSLAFVQFIWKEIYIVMQVHLLLAWANNFMPREHFKVLLGPLGAFASLGGIIGGLLTSFISAKVGTTPVMLVGILFVFAPALCFLATPTLRVEEKKNSVSPIASLNDPTIRRYVIMIAGIVALTQFIINIADFNFHVQFEQSIADPSRRTEYLGYIYSSQNLLTFIFQLIVLPFILPRVSEKNYHLFIPLSYLVCAGALTMGSSMGLLPVAALFTYFKAADYSLFVAGKEILYQPLGQLQKYGAKYLTDMLVYRTAKAMIAAVLIYLQSSMILNGLMLFFLLVWIGLIIQLFKLHKKLF